MSGMIPFVVNRVVVGVLALAIRIPVVITVVVEFVLVGGVAVFLVVLVVRRAPESRRVK